jgi:hypothetical protein
VKADLRSTDCNPDTADVLPVAVGTVVAVVVGLDIAGTAVKEGIAAAAAAAVGHRRDILAAY